MKKIVLTFLAMVMLCVSVSAYTMESYSDIISKTILAIKVLYYTDYKVLHTFTDSLRKGNTYTYTTNFNADTTYKIIAMGGDGIKDLDIAVYSERGVEIAKDVKNDNAPEVEFKLYESQQCKIEIKSYDTELGKESDDNLFLVLVAKRV